MARDLQDAIKWNIFLQLLTHIPALSGPDHLASITLSKNNAKVLENFVEKVVFAKRRENAMDKLREYISYVSVLIIYDSNKANVHSIIVKWVKHSHSKKLGKKNQLLQRFSREVFPSPSSQLKCS